MEAIPWRLFHGGCFSLIMIDAVFILFRFPTVFLVIFRSFIGLRKIKNNKQRKNIQTMRMSSRGKSTRYLFLKSVHNTFVTMVIKAPKHLIQGHQYNSPVQFVSSVNRNGDITVKGLVTRNDVRFLINDCYYGSSRLRSRQTLLVKHG